MRHLSLVVLAAIAARITAWAILGSAHRLEHLEPSQIAANLNAGRGYVFEQYGALYQAWKEPLYNVVLAGLIRLFGDGDLPILVFQGLFGVSVAVGMWLIARQVLHDDLAATIAGVLAGLNPFLVYYDTHFVHPLSLDTLFYVLAAGALLVALEPARLRLSLTLFASLAMGVALWERATLLVSGGAMWLVALAWPSRRRRRIFLHAILWGAVALLALAPWLVRNHAILGRWVVTTDVAHIMWLGNNPLSNGTYSDDRGQRVFYLADPAFQASIVGHPELDQMDAFSQATLQFITSHPGDFFRLVAGRAWYFFWFSPNAGVDYPAWASVLYGAAYVGLLAMGLAGLGLYWKRAGPEDRFKATLLCASLGGLAALYALSAVNLKHRVPLELVLGLFAGVTLAWLRNLIQGLAHSRARHPPARTC